MWSHLLTLGNIFKCENVYNSAHSFGDLNGLKEEHRKSSTSFTSLPHSVDYTVVYNNTKNKNKTPKKTFSFFKNSIQNERKIIVWKR